MTRYKSFSQKIHPWALPIFLGKIKIHAGRVDLQTQFLKEGIRVRFAT